MRFEFFIKPEPLLNTYYILLHCLAGLLCVLMLPFLWGSVFIFALTVHFIIGYFGFFLNKDRHIVQMMWTIEQGWHLLFADERREPAELKTYFIGGALFAVLRFKCANRYFLHHVFILPSTLSPLQYHRLRVLLKWVMH